MVESTVDESARQLIQTTSELKCAHVHEPFFCPLHIMIGEGFGVKSYTANY